MIRNGRIHQLRPFIIIPLFFLLLFFIFFSSFCFERLLLLCFSFYLLVGLWGSRRRRRRTRRQYNHVERSQSVTSRVPFRYRRRAPLCADTFQEELTSQKKKKHPMSYTILYRRFYTHTTETLAFLFQHAQGPCTRSFKLGC